MLVFLGRLSFGGFSYGDFPSAVFLGWFSYGGFPRVVLLVVLSLNHYFLSASKTGSLSQTFCQDR